MPIPIETDKASAIELSETKVPPLNISVSPINAGRAAERIMPKIIPIKPTPLLRYSNLSSSSFSEYYSELLSKDLVKEVVDSKGKKYREF